MHELFNYDTRAASLISDSERDLIFHDFASPLETHGRYCEFPMISILDFTNILYNFTPNMTCNKAIYVQFNYIKTSSNKASVNLQSE